MLNLHTDKGILHFTREQRSNLPLTLNVAFKDQKQVRCFLDPYKPWILPEDARFLLHNPKNSTWKADVTNVEAFEVVSRDGKETTGVIPVDGNLSAVVRGYPVKDKDGNEVMENGRKKLFFRARLVCAGRGAVSHLDNIPERFKVFPKVRHLRDCLKLTRENQ